MTMSWPRMNAKVPMKPMDSEVQTHFFVKEDPQLDTETDRLSNILDAKYSKCDLDEFVGTSDHLNHEEKELLLEVLKKHETLFDGTLGQWIGEPYHIQLKDDVKPYHGKPYTVPHAYEQMLKVELEQ